MVKKMSAEDYHECMQNAYLLILDKITFNELLEYNGCSLPYPPKKKINSKVFNNLIDYFCTIEEYEKCAELKKSKESKKYKKNFLNL
jgi:hypothetical protein